MDDKRRVGGSVRLLPWWMTIGVLERHIAPRPITIPLLQPFEKTRLLQTKMFGRELFALWCPPASKRKSVVVYFHGLGQQLSEQPLDFVRRLSSTLGVGVLAIEYPGFGLAHDSQPKSERAIYEDVQHWLEIITTDGGIARDRLVLVGYSLGTGVAAEMAKRGWGHQLILVAPYTSVPAMIRQKVPMLGALVEWGVADRFDTLSKAPTIAIPTTIIHGSHDQVIPWTMSKQLVRAFPNAKLIILQNADHFIFRSYPTTIYNILQQTIK